MAAPGKGSVKGRFKICQVRSLLSHAGPGEPASLFTAGGWREVDEILDRWYEGGMDPQEQLILYFKVRCAEDSYLLRYLPHFHRWQVLEPAEP